MRNAALQADRPNRHGDSTDRALAETEVVGIGVDHHTPGIADHDRRLLGFGQIAAANQQRHIGMGGVQGACGLVSNGTRTSGEK